MQAITNLVIVMMPVIIMGLAIILKDSKIPYPKGL